ncbi:hypothetical protein CR194_11925 [Salipaludibacillus keqinensis]|uniref:Uncharacterized protein n=1 Tax=Salipaludibacillus keqinensis TaxID=2045207 RepID=A0A323TG79_9BACI|nr:hypothetical protein [Salipaludibacillus keqinensis]PYZ93841.1 hypothetical protein CR194_11925 [Salipaludibacillus keqinensis]
MQRNKIIILIAGTIILLILIFIMSWLDREGSSPNTTQSNSGVTETTENTNNEIQNDEQSNSENSLNVQSDEGLNEANEGTNELDDREIQEIAQETILQHDLNESATELSEETLYNHFLLFSDYRSTISEEEDLASNENESQGEWPAIELKGWYDHAVEEYQFTYSEDHFLQFIREENLLENEERSLKILFDELENTNENLYIRQLEIHYLKPYIWENVKQQVASDTSEDSTEDEDYQHFRSFEQEILNDLIEKHPEMFESE